MFFKTSTYIPDSYKRTLEGIDFEKQLNTEQLKAVKAPQEPCLVLAGAGSGKTRILIYRAAWLLKQGVHPSEILLITFTNKAAKEMLNRLFTLTGIPSEQFFGGTFHSAGQRLIRNYGEVIRIQKNFSILNESESEALFKRAIETKEISFIKDKENPRPKVLYKHLSFARNTGQSIEAVLRQKAPYLVEKIELIETFNKTYESLKKEENVCDYDDLLEKWIDLLDIPSTAEKLQKRFKCILVDEYQDTNYLNAGIVQDMSKLHENVTVVGDSWQSIYGWRGSLLSNFKDFSKTFPNHKTYSIQYNYRSTPQILNLANQIMQDHPPLEGYPLVLESQQQEGPLPQIIQAFDTKQQALIIQGQIQELQEKGENLNDIAILYRAHYHSLDLQISLSSVGIPYKVTSGVRFFEQAHIRDFLAQLQIINNPKDASCFERFVTLIPKIGPKTAQRIFKLIHQTSIKEKATFIESCLHPTILKKIPLDAKSIWEAMAVSLNDMQISILEEKGTSLELYKIIEKGIDGWYGNFLKILYENWQSRYEDLISLVGFSKDFNTLQELLDHLTLVNEEYKQSSKKNPNDGVQMSTIHRAKGLEFKTVFVIGLAEELFPNKRAIEDGQIDEELRLFYVAVTRAKRNLYLFYPQIIYSGGPPRYLEISRFLKDLPQEIHT